MNSNKYKLLIFDWDGTLVNSIERITTSLQAASHSVCNISVSDTDARNVIGLGLHEAITKLHPHLDNDVVSKVSEKYKHHYINENQVSENPFAGTDELLESLKSQGYLLAIATGKSRVGLDRSLNQWDMQHWFQSTQCAGENKSKPHPQMLLNILQELSINAEAAVMIGDSTHDLAMAKNANVDSIGVTHGVHDEPELSALNPLTCLNKVTDLDHYLHHNKLA